MINNERDSYSTLFHVDDPDEMQPVWFDELDLVPVYSFIQNGEHVEYDDEMKKYVNIKIRNL